MDTPEQVDLDWAWKPFAATMLSNPDMLYWIPPLYRSPTSTLTRTSQSDPVSVSRSPSNATTIRAGSLRLNTINRFSCPEHKFISSIYLFAQDNAKPSTTEATNQRNVSVAYLTSDTFVENGNPLTLAKISQALNNTQNMSTNSLNPTDSPSPVAITLPDTSVIKVTSPVAYVNDATFSEISLQDMANIPSSSVDDMPVSSHFLNMTEGPGTDIVVDKLADGSQIDDRSSFSTTMDERLLYSLAQANSKSRVRKRIIICLIVTFLAAVSVIVILVALLTRKETSQ